MSKAQLHLSIDTEIIELAKSLNINLSEEFEQWLRIRTNRQIVNTTEPKDIDLEIAKYRNEISKLESQKEVRIKADNMEKEVVMVIDYQIDDMAKSNEDLSNPEPIRCNGLCFLFKKKFNRVIIPLTAKELLINRAKERKLI